MLPGSPTRNLLINSLHPRLVEVRGLGQQPVVFDERLRPAPPVSRSPRPKSNKQ